VANAIQSYKDLSAWQKGMTLSVLCYELTKTLSKEEMYGLVAQIRRAAVSVPANIAEGHGREQMRPFVQFVRVAQGSLKELETHLLIAEQVGLLHSDALAGAYAVIDEIGRMLRALIRSLQDKLGDPAEV